MNKYFNLHTKFHTKAVLSMPGGWYIMSNSVVCIASFRIHSCLFQPLALFPESDNRETDHTALSATINLGLSQ